MALSPLEKAALESFRRAARTHDGVRNLVSEHFIRSGRLAREAIATAEGFPAAVDTLFASP